MGTSPERGITMRCTRSHGAHVFHCLVYWPWPGERGRYPAQIFVRQSRYMNAFARLVARLVALVSVLLILGCGRPIKGSVEFGFRNLSTEVIWVESATFSTADAGTGSLYPRSEYNALVFPRFEDAPAEMMIEWWHGQSHERPKSAESIFSQKVVLPHLDPEATKWYVYLTFTKDGKWLAKQVE